VVAAVQSSCALGILSIRELEAALQFRPCFRLGLDVCREMKNRSVAVLMLFLALPLAACSPTLRRPQLLHPGPAGFQRNNALLFDPYPSDDLGPEIVGGRPRGFQKPPQEITRSRQQSPLAPWRGPRPVLPPVVPAFPAPRY